MRVKEFTALLALAALWGGSFLFMRVAAPVLGPVALAAVRVALAGIALLGYAAAIGKRPAFRGYGRRFVVLGILNGVAPYTLIGVAELRLTASLASILNALTPLCTTIVAAIWLHDRLKTRSVVGALLGILGVAVLVGGSALPADIATVVAVSASILAAASYGMAAVYTKVAFRGDLPSLTLATGQQLGASLVLIPLAVPVTIATTPPLNLTAGLVGAIIALAILCTSVAYLLYFFLIASVGPTGAASVTLLVPVFGVVWGALFLHEALHVGALVGLAIILASVVLITGIGLPTPRATATAGESRT